MPIPTRFVLEQGPALKGMGQAAFSVLKQRMGGVPKKQPALPTKPIEARYAARPKDLVRAYVRHVGGDPSAYKKIVPAHFFPQWGLGLASQTLDGLPYPLMRAMNGGCRLRINTPLPANEPLHVRAWIDEIDDDGRRAIVSQRVITSTPSAPDALDATLFVFIPLSRKKGKKKSGSGDDKSVPLGARQVAHIRLGTNAGLDFAKLTGDFNPLHWVKPYAQAAGFRSTILHGFGTMARAIEGLNRGMYAGDVNAIEEVHVRFTKPLTLPAKVGVYVEDNTLAVGPAPGGGAYLKGTFEEKSK